MIMNVFQMKYYNFFVWFLNKQIILDSLYDNEFPGLINMF